MNPVQWGFAFWLTLEIVRPPWQGLSWLRRMSDHTRIALLFVARCSFTNLLCNSLPGVLCGDSTMIQSAAACRHDALHGLFYVQLEHSDNRWDQTFSQMPIRLAS